MHTHYKGTGKVHSFRGLLGDGKQQEINIQGSVGSIAWRITKFEVMGRNPLDDESETVMKVYRESQPAASSAWSLVDMTENELLAVALWTVRATARSYPINQIVIFDNALFVRNIFVTMQDGSASTGCNYYIELEEVTVSTAGKAQLALAAVRRTKKY